eukprot:TRINITY_DN112367_c0_g1_i1.p1 TRINITY_DN112367_c0_g1~~TRINITY_DN112367_c0_g1_i1.p1  ORF type:complete len:387 (-),score=22.25 TRINITY_DN112367_c0_g1_i1:37-1197(-)
MSGSAGLPRRKLILHFDVNETIMIGDPVSGIDFQESLNNVLAKAAFVTTAGDCWHDGSPLEVSQRAEGSVAPSLLTDFAVPPGQEQYFAKFRRDASWPSAEFTKPGKPGSVYRPLYEKFQHALTWRHAPSEIFAPRGNHFLLPAFFRTISELKRSGRNFSVVLRTFGTDLPEVSCCLESFARAEHPDFCGFRCDDIQKVREDACWALRRVDRSDTQSPLLLRRYSQPLGKSGYGDDLRSPDPIAHDAEIDSEADIVRFFESKAAVGVRDDYFHWKGNQYVPQGGKPLWLTLQDDETHHIFFDDNIHNKDNDSIVAIRARENADEPFWSVSGSVTKQLEGVFLVKAHPVDSIRDQDYFLKQTHRCEANLQRMQTDGSLRELVLSGRP